MPLKKQLGQTLSLFLIRQLEHGPNESQHDRRTTCQAERRRGRGQNEPEPWCQLNVTYAFNETKKTE